MINRRTFLQGSVWASVVGLVSRRAFADSPATPRAQPPIDRRALVSRHNVSRTHTRRRSPLQVGDGNIAFGADITGLQTFAGFNILSQWGWHTDPLPAGLTPADMKDELWQARDRKVTYDSGDPQHPAITAWVFGNPSRMNLGQIGLTLKNADGSPAGENDLKDARQELDLWTGTLNSQFTIDGQAVTVTTACHPVHDAIAVRIESPLIGSGRVRAFLDFPAPDDRQFADHVGTWIHSGKIPTTVTHESPRRIDLVRQADQDHYHIAVLWQAGTSLQKPDANGAPHRSITIVKARYGAEQSWLDVTKMVADKMADPEAEITANNATFGSDPALKHVKRLEVTYTIDGIEHTDHVNENGTWAISDFGGLNCFRLSGEADAIEFIVGFSPDAIAADLPDAPATFAAAMKHWPEFWQSGAAIDLSASTDPRWHELERRIVLSQYLTAVNSAGDWPPQESGLVNTGWFGKFHMEMYWWHAAHFALWNRWPLLDRSLGVYDRMLDSAKARAARQGYKGARWTKMTGPDGRNAAYITNALLAWQEPHPMFFAELDYRAHPNRSTLEKWQTVLSEAADFMASYACWNPDTRQYDLGPPMALVSENTDDKITTDPTFELSYWRFGLRIAQTWRERLGLARDANWDHVLNNLAPLPIADGVYVTYKGIPEMWTHYNFEHPALTGVFGWLPGDGVDLAVMHATFDRVIKLWRFNDVWGWDWPMLAMCAARLGLAEKAVNLLLTPTDRFKFDDAGLATGGPFPYFPSNGGLLYAIAMMAAGWDGAPDRPAPGFPANGKWVVRSEGLSRAI